MGDALAIVLMMIRSGLFHVAFCLLCSLFSVLGWVVCSFASHPPFPLLFVSAMVAGPGLSAPLLLVLVFLILFVVDAVSGLVLTIVCTVRTRTTTLTILKLIRLIQC